MADTIQGVQWSLGADERRAGFLWFPGGRQDPEEVLVEAVYHAKLGNRLCEAFPRTRPFWYGLWIESPLTAPQCSVLQELYREVLRAVPRYRQYIGEFPDALAEALATGQPLRVALCPPGHCDLGWITTFVHCPRCKESYPETPVACRVCGHRYSPAATCSCERRYAGTPVVCAQCGATYRARDFTDQEMNLLENQHDYHGFCEELGWLRRVEAFYQRHPNVARKVKPHFMRVMESDDPLVQEQIAAGVPFSEIALPSEPTDHPHPWSEEDQAVNEYLKHNYCDPYGRRRFVEERIEELHSLVETSSVACPACGGKVEETTPQKESA
jgi:hypothetical protein